jgi:hypothetical protein
MSKEIKNLEDKAVNIIKEADKDKSLEILLFLISGEWDDSIKQNTDNENKEQLEEWNDADKIEIDELSLIAVLDETDYILYGTKKEYDKNKKLMLTKMIEKFGKEEK